jgi:hypothetical protein
MRVTLGAWGKSSAWDKFLFVLEVAIYLLVAVVCAGLVFHIS